MSRDSGPIQHPEQPESGPEAARSGRRDALKKGAVAAGLAGATWVAPRVEGLSLRPDHAAAQSGGVSNPLDIPIPDGTSNINLGVSPSGSVNLTVTQADGTLTIVRDAGACTFTNVDGTGNLTNFNVGPVITPDQISGTVTVPDSGIAEISVTMICT